MYCQFALEVKRDEKQIFTLVFPTIADCKKEARYTRKGWVGNGMQIDTKTQFKIVDRTTGKVIYYADESCINGWRLKWKQTPL